MRICIERDERTLYWRNIIGFSYNLPWHWLRKFQTKPNVLFTQNKTRINVFILGIDDFCIARNTSINLGDFSVFKNDKALFKTVPVAV